MDEWILKFTRPLHECCSAHDRNLPPFSVVFAVIPKGCLQVALVVAGIYNSASKSLAKGLDQWAPLTTRSSTRFNGLKGDFFSLKSLTEHV